MKRNKHLLSADPANLPEKRNKDETKRKTLLPWRQNKGGNLSRARKAQNVFRIEDFQKKGTLMVRGKTKKVGLLELLGIHKSSNSFFLF